MTSSVPETLPQLAFAVEGAEAVRFAAAPTLAFALRIESDLPVRSLALSVQIRIVPTRRSYDAADEDGLVELFGTPERWGETLRSFLWTNATLVVPPFEGRTVAELPVACTYDLEVAATKYFHALGDGDVPLELLFSGTVFYVGDEGQLRTAKVPWECEAQFRLPVGVWKEAIARSFPGAAWLRLRQDVFDRLAAYKARGTHPTWEAAIEELLER
ncbi:MAG: hypothetical protein E6G08_07410 [Actinobacteria bacterium]|nr:MAG: hypothetical protein E6G08_07410 [Actinomycetota bacterium]